MKRRSKAGGKPVKTRHRNAATPKRSNAPKFTRRRGSPATGLSKKVALFKRERDEALERQTATSEVLRVISSSPGDLKPIFAVILANATRLCQANFGVLFLCEGDAYHAVAMHNAPSAFVEARQREPLVSMTGTTILAQVARTKRTIQTADITKDPAYHKNPRSTQVFVRLTGARSFVAVPMLKDDELVGTIAIYRQEVRSFTDKQIELVQNFAAQAVIAIENRGCLANYGNRWNSRPLRRMCYASSAHRPASWSRSSPPCWKTPRASAVRSSAISGSANATISASLQHTARHRNTATICTASR
jgi:hypothetical protein